MNGPQVSDPKLTTNGTVREGSGNYDDKIKFYVFFCFNFRYSCVIILIALKPSLTFSPWQGGSWCPQPQDRGAEGSELLHTALLSAGGYALCISIF